MGRYNIYDGECKQSSTVNRRKARNKRGVKRSRWIHRQKKLILKGERIDGRR